MPLEGQLVLWVVTSIRYNLHLTSNIEYPVVNRPTVDRCPLSSLLAYRTLFDLFALAHPLH